jgi:catechol 2,3-dioxygenase-like lactoylglutathione lyase family enzyme
VVIKSISHITVYVSDQDQALRWYQNNLGFEVCMDNDVMLPGKRWLTVCPAGNQALQFVLVLASNEEEQSRVGNNLMTVLASNDCIGDMATLARGEVEIVGPPEEMPWGISGIIRDLYGNPYNLVGPR